MLYFHDLPVYRLAPDAYYAEANAMADKIMEPVLSLPDITKDIIAERRRYVDTMMQFPPWEYNEIVGYIRLHFVGTQVRGEYCGRKKKRIVRTHTQVLHLISIKLANEVTIANPLGGQSIFESVQVYVDRCRSRLPRRYLDDSWLKQVGPYIDWPALLSARSKNHDVIAR